MQSSSQKSTNSILPPINFSFVLSRFNHNLFSGFKNFDSTLIIDIVKE